MDVREKAFTLLQKSNFKPKQLENIALMMSKNGLLNLNNPFYQLIIKHRQKAISNDISKPADIDTFIHNELVMNYIYPQYLSFYKKLKVEFEDSSDPMDIAILGLLNPDVHQRWTAGQVLNG